MLSRVRACVAASAQLFEQGISVGADELLEHLRCNLLVNPKNQSFKFFSLDILGVSACFGLECKLGITPKMLDACKTTVGVSE